MATIYSYAQMADAVYDSDPQVAGWTRIAFRPSGDGWSDAFQGAVFQRKHEVVIACKGTSQGRDVVADVKLGVGMNSSQYSSAEKFARESGVPKSSHVVVTGHSLGGAIAQIVGNRRRLPFVTFNAPGVGLISRNVGEVVTTAAIGTAAIRTGFTALSAIRHPMQAARDLGSVFYRVTGVNFRLGKDVVGCIGVHYGQVIEIPYDGGALDVGTKHKMTSMLEALETSPYRDRDFESVAT